MVASPKIPKEMLSLASHILDSKAGHFEPSEFKVNVFSGLKAGDFLNRSPTFEAETENV